MDCKPNQRYRLTNAYGRSRNLLQVDNSGMKLDTGQLFSCLSPMGIVIVPVATILSLGVNFTLTSFQSYVTVRVNETVTFLLNAM